MYNNQLVGLAGILNRKVCNQVPRDYIDENKINQTNYNNLTKFQG